MNDSHKKVLRCTEWLRPKTKGLNMKANLTIWKK